VFKSPIHKHLNDSGNSAVWEQDSNWVAVPVYFKQDNQGKVLSNDGYSIFWGNTHTSTLRAKISQSALF